MQTEIADNYVYAASTGLLRMPARQSVFVAIRTFSTSVDVLSARITTTSPMLSWRRTTAGGEGANWVSIPSYNCDTLRISSRPANFYLEHWTTGGTGITNVTPLYFLGNQKGMVEHNIVRQPLEHVTRLHSGVFHVWSINNLDTVPHDVSLDLILRENRG